MKKNYLLKAALLSCAVAFSANALADDDNDNYGINTGVVQPCSNLWLVNDPANSTVCVDIPVNFTKVKVVFNLDSLVTAGGISYPPPATSNDPSVSVGLRHMVMLATAIKNRLDAGTLDPNKVSVIANFHGKALPWVLNDAWWQAQINPATGAQAYPNGNPYKGMINQLFDLKRAGVNIQLEACGVTLRGSNLTRDNVYTRTKDGTEDRVYVNQGALGRIIYLQSKGYTYIQEGYNDKDHNLFN